MMTLPTLPPLLQTLLTASAYASLFALVILLLQPLLQRCISARWRFLLWMLVLIRFLPLSLPESRFSIFNYLPRSTVAAIQPPAPIVTTSVSIPSAPMIVPHTSSPVESAPQEPVALVQQITPKPAAAFPWLASLYFLGTSLLFLRLLLASLSLHKILRHSTPITDPSLLATLHSAQHSLNLYKPIPLLQTDALSSPALVGLFRPKLLLPSHLLSTLNPEEFRQIFLHEAAHLRRRDIALNYFFSALTLLHWFNPILWLILPRIKADRELACDELVLQHTADPSTYGHTLLKIFQTNARPTPTLALGIIDTKTFFKRRIHMIAQFKKRPAWLALPAVAALLIITACTLTTAQTPASSSTASVPNSSGNNPAYTAKPNTESVTGTYTLHDMNLSTARALIQKISPQSVIITKSERSHDIEIIAPTAKELQEVTDALVVAERAAQDALPTLRAAADTLKNDQASLAQRQAELQRQAEVMEQQQVVRQKQMDALMVDRRTLSEAKSYAADNPLASITLEELSFDNVPFTTVIDYLRDKTGLNIIVNSKLLKDYGIDLKDAMVSLHLKKVPFTKTLTLLLAQVNPNLGYAFEDNVLTISTKEDLFYQPPVIECYNVRDLLDKQNLQTNGPHPIASTQPTFDGNNDIQAISALMTLIETTCEPQSWKDAGGGNGTIVDFKGILTITTTPQNHEKIHHVLETLRAADKQSAQ